MDFESAYRYLTATTGSRAALTIALCLCAFGSTSAALATAAVATTDGAAETDVVAEMAAKKSRMQAQAKQMMAKKPMMAGSDIRNHLACNTSGIALAGVDVVSYHKPTGPLIGSADYTATHGGLTYRFLSEAHAAEFTADPEKYLPKYLGWCATSLAVGALTCPNPLNYKIENGELLLFETTGFTNGQNLWNADPLDYRRRADLNQDTFLQMPGG